MNKHAKLVNKKSLKNKKNTFTIQFQNLNKNNYNLKISKSNRIIQLKKKNKICNIENHL